MPVRLTLLLLAAMALLPGGAHAASPLVPLLTGGELRSSGTAVIATEQEGRSFPYDPPSPDECDTSPGSSQCDSYGDFSLHKRADVVFDTTWLVDGRYPGVPADPAASPSAVRWLERMGSWTYRSTNEVHHLPDSQGEGEDHDSSSAACDRPIVAVDRDGRPDGALRPLVALGGEGELFSPGRHRSFFLNPYGGAKNDPVCGAGDGHGVWLVLGLVPADGERMTWELGDEPPRQEAVERRGVVDRRTPCDPGDRQTDGSPRDRETCVDVRQTSATNRLQCALCVRDLRFEQHPGGGSGWVPVPDEGTFDGNEVRVTATIENRHTRTLSVPVAFRDRGTGRALPAVDALPPTVEFPPGATREVTMTWRTDGFAWEGGRPRSERDVQVLTPYGGAERRLVVRPRPVVLVHGWNADATTWAGYDAILRSAHPLWRGHAVGDGAFRGRMDTDPARGASIVQNAHTQGTYIEDLRRKLGADHVDVVAHSMGGLISRRYVHSVMRTAEDGRPVVRSLVMLGTPNRGSPCADLIVHVQRGVPTHELGTANAVRFNETVTATRGVAFSVMAGVVQGLTCGVADPGDLVVGRRSAWHTFADVDRSVITHLTMTSSRSLFDRFVRPRLAVDPDGGRAPSAARARDARATWADGPRAAAARAAATAPATRSATPVATATRRVAPRRPQTVTVRLPAGGRPGFALTAPPTVGAELRDGRGRVVARQRAGSEAATAPVRWIAPAGKRSGGTWRLRLTGRGTARVVATATGSALALRATARQPRAGGRVRVTAQVLHRRRPVRGARVRARLLSDTGRRATVVLRATRVAGRYAGTSRALPPGRWFAQIDARRGRLQVLGTAATG